MIASTAKNVYWRGRAAAERAPQDRDLTGSLALFANRGALILLVGATFLLVGLVLVAVASGNAIAVFCAMLVSFVAVLLGSLTVVKKRIVTELKANIVESSATTQPASESAIKHEQRHDVTTELAEVHTSLATLTKSLTEIEGRVAYLHEYFDCALTEEKESNVDWHLQVEENVAKLQERVAQLTDTVERLLEPVEEKELRRPHRKPR